MGAVNGAEDIANRLMLEPQSLELLAALGYNARAFSPLEFNVLRALMEINPLLNHLSDLQARTDVLRGYL